MGSPAQRRHTHALRLPLPWATTTTPPATGAAWHRSHGPQRSTRRCCRGRPESRQQQQQHLLGNGPGDAAQRRGVAGVCVCVVCLRLLACVCAGPCLADGVAPRAVVPPRPPHHHRRPTTPGSQDEQHVTAHGAADGGVQGHARMKKTDSRTNSTTSVSENKEETAAKRDTRAKRATNDHASSTRVNGKTKAAREHERCTCTQHRDAVTKTRRHGVRRRKGKRVLRQARQPSQKPHNWARARSHALHTGTPARPPTRPLSR
jgi:hypothetical protein